MSNLLERLYRQSINFGIRDEFILPLQFEGEDSALIVEVAAVGSNPKKNSFGTVTPLLFIPESGFVEGQSLRLKFGSNQVRIDTAFATSFRLRINPYAQSKINSQITIFRPLYEINPMGVYPLSGNSAPVANTGTNTLVPVLGTVTSLLPANPARVGLTLQNLGLKTTYIGFSNAVTAASYAIALAAGTAYEFPAAFTGALFAISASGTQSVNCIEMIA